MIKLFLIAGYLLAILYGALFVQLFVLHGIFKSRSWLLLACGALVYGARAFWVFVSLPDQIIKSYTQQVAARVVVVTAEQMLIEIMTLEAWLMLTAAFVAPLFLIAAMEYQRRDLRAFDVDTLRPRS